MNPDSDNSATRPRALAAIRLDAASRLALRHAPLIAFALFAVAGLVVLDDYGVSVDEGLQRRLGAGAVDWALANENGYIPDNHLRFYGMAFEAALVAAERASGLDDLRPIFLTRHLLTHAFFLIGALAAAALAYRMFGNRWLALFAMLAFILHPRIYAHSFYNSKDPPFLSAFAISLWLIHRAFARNRAWDFALCGAAVGIATNIRLPGAGLFLAVAGLLALDFVRAIWTARGLKSADAKRVLGCLAAFSLASALTLYATWHILWADPMAFIRGFGEVANHPNLVIQLFRGELIPNDSLPPYFVPFWIAITTPPIALALAAVGIGATLWGAARRPTAALANGETRFRLLLIACFALPLGALAVLTPNVSNGWRQFYFLYAPMCLLAACGVDALVRAATSRFAARRLRFISQDGMASAACALAAFGLATAALETASIHPHQGTYFNIFAERDAPGRLRTQYDMEYYGPSIREGLSWLTDEYPDAPLSVRSQIVWLNYAKMILPKGARDRITREDDMPDFYITNHREHALSGNLESDMFAPAIYKRKVYRNEIMSVLAVNLDMADAETAAPYRRLWDDAESGALGAPIIRAEWDVYMDTDADALIYLREPCAAEDARGFFSLTAAPVNPNDAPKTDARLGGLDSLTFHFSHYGVRFGERCLIRRPLPDYPIRALKAGRFVSGESAVWEELAILPMDDDALSAYRTAHQSARNGGMGEPIVRSAFDVYLDGDALIYVREQCDEDDTRGRFLLSVFPENADDVPEEMRLRGLAHESLNFDFAMRGVMFDGKCMAWRGLPPYPISAVETGQWVPGGAKLWSERVAVGE